MIMSEKHAPPRVILAEPPGNTHVFGTVLLYQLDRPKAEHRGSAVSEGHQRFGGFLLHFSLSMGPNQPSPQCNVPTNMEVDNEPFWMVLFFFSPTV